MSTDVKIGCLCVTERRSPIFGIAYASFLEQDYEDRILLVAEKAPDIIPKGFTVKDSPVGQYFKVIKQFDKNKYSDVYLVNYSGNVQKRLGSGFATLFEEYNCDLVTMWDDDDYRPPNSLDVLSYSYRNFPDIRDTPYVVSYGEGYFVNLRNLHGEFVELDHLWGGCLTFNRAAWEAGGGFSNKSFPGYDKEFVEAVRESKGAISELFMAEDDQYPIAFSHGKNACTFLREPGQPMEEKLRDWMPSSVFDEVKRAQQFMIDKRVFPPWS